MFAASNTEEMLLQVIWAVDIPLLAMEGTIQGIRLDIQVVCVPIVFCMKLQTIDSRKCKVLGKACTSVCVFACMSYCFFCYNGHGDDVEPNL